ncbi:MAG: hypothetical protein ABIH03_17385 [Pseudomonadota bacterium]
MKTVWERIEALADKAVAIDTDFNGKMGCEASYTVRRELRNEDGYFEGDGGCELLCSRGNQRVFVRAGTEGYYPFYFRTMQAAVEAAEDASKDLPSQNSQKRTGFLVETPKDAPCPEEACDFAEALRRWRDRSMRDERSLLDVLRDLRDLDTVELMRTLRLFEAESRKRTIRAGEQLDSLRDVTYEGKAK